jgi:hypothetical protein
MEISLTHLNALRAALVAAKAALDPHNEITNEHRVFVRAGLMLNIAQIDKHVGKEKSKCAV